MCISYPLDISYERALRLIYIDSVHDIWESLGIEREVQFAGNTTSSYNSADCNKACFRVILFDDIESLHLPNCSLKISSKGPQFRLNGKIFNKTA